METNQVSYVDRFNNETHYVQKEKDELGNDRHEYMKVKSSSLYHTCLACLAQYETACKNPGKRSDLVKSALNEYKTEKATLCLKKFAEYVVNVCDKYGNDENNFVDAMFKMSWKQEYNPEQKKQNLKQNLKQFREHVIENIVNVDEKRDQEDVTQEYIDSYKFYVEGNKKFAEGNKFSHNELMTKLKDVDIVLLIKSMRFYLYELLKHSFVNNKHNFEKWEDLEATFVVTIENVPVIRSSLEYSEVVKRLLKVFNQFLHFYPDLREFKFVANQINDIDVKIKKEELRAKKILDKQLQEKAEDEAKQKILKEKLEKQEKMRQNIAKMTSQSFEKTLKPVENKWLKGNPLTGFK